MSIEDLIIKLEERKSLCENRVEKAIKQNDKINSAYHGGEIASLNFALGLLK
jgi:hypothetical protein